MVRDKQEVMRRQIGGRDRKRQVRDRKWGRGVVRDRQEVVRDKRNSERQTGSG